MLEKFWATRRFLHRLIGRCIWVTVTVARGVLKGCSRRISNPPKRRNTRPTKKVTPHPDPSSNTSDSSRIKTAMQPWNLRKRRCQLRAGGFYFFLSAGCIHLQNCEATGHMCSPGTPDSGPLAIVMICYGHVHFPFTSWIHLVDGRKHMHLVCGQVASDSPHPHQRGVHKYAFEPSWKRPIRAKRNMLHPCKAQVLPHHVGSSLPELGRKYGAKLLGKEMVSLHQNKLVSSSSVLLREWFLCSTFFVKLCSVVLIII